MRPRIDFRSTSKAAYADFKKQYPSEELSFPEFKKILLLFNSLLVDYILETGDRLKLPFGLGEISVAKYKPRRTKTFQDKTGATVTIPGLPINWQKTRQQGKIIYHLNSHTDGHKYRWKWFRTKARFSTSKCFSFRANRITSRKLAHYLKKDPKYPQLYRLWED
jgi:hypothetical protein